MLKKLSVMLGALAFVAVAGLSFVSSPAEAKTDKYCVFHSAKSKWVQVESTDDDHCSVDTSAGACDGDIEDDAELSLDKHGDHPDDNCCLKTTVKCSKLPNS